MPSANGTVTIDRPIAEVFAFVADGEKGPQWRSPGIEVHKESGRGVGTRYAQTVPGPMGRRIAADYEIMVLEPDHRIEFQTVTGPVRPHGRYDFEAVLGGTQVTFSLEAPLGGIRGLFMGGAVQKSMDAEVAALANLKRVIEGEPAAGSVADPPLAGLS